MLKKTSIVLTTLTLLTGVPVEAKTLRGDAFITAMDGNTLFGNGADGMPFKIYFLPGGQVTIQQGSAHPKYGHWKAVTSASNGPSRQSLIPAAFASTWTVTR